jgi:hypothetical protein
MALWQLKIEIIPRERVKGRPQIEPAQFDDALWWSDRQPPEAFRNELADLLPLTKSWHERLRWFGEENGDRIGVWLEQDRVESIEVRIDCRKANPPLIARLLSLAHRWDCSLVEKRYLKVLPLTAPEFVKAVADSPSCRFMEDPAHWLPKLAAEVEAAKGGR